MSRQSNSITLDFEKVQAELKTQSNSIKIITICSRIEGENAGFSNLFSFAWATIRSMYHTATSSVCVLDAYWPTISILKHKKSLTVIQMWHALGKIKKSGYQTLGKASGRSIEIAKLLKMHEGYDYIIAGGKAWNKFYCESFNVSEDKLLNYGLPRIDYLLETEEQNRDKIFSKYPELKDKVIILYAPTFRRNIELNWEGLLSEFTGNDVDKACYAFVIKGHPNQKLKTKNRFAYEVPEFTAVELLSVCDYLITDYSAIAIEGAILNRPTYYFVYDYDEYRTSNGMNIDLFEVMPSATFRNAGEIADLVKNGKYCQEELDDYRKKYLPEGLGTSTKKIAKLIIDNMHK